MKATVLLMLLLLTLRAEVEYAGMEIPANERSALAAHLVLKK